MRHAVATAALLLAACATGPTRKELKTAEIHHDLGAEALQKGTPPEALREFDAALAAYPDMPEAHRGRGLTLEFGFGRTKEAEAEYRQAIKLRKNYSEAYNDLGQLMANGGRWDEALAAFDEALASPFYREPWVARCNKGLALHGMGRPAEGHRELKTCLTIAPRYCKGRRELGRIYLAEGKLKEALEELETYARDCDQVVDAHLQLAQARMKAGDLPGAKSSFERCLALSRGAPSGDECRKSLELLQ